MTDKQVQEGFDEVYNRFWRKYRDNIPGPHSEEWERLHTYSVVLQKKYPFLSQREQPERREQPARQEQQEQPERQE